jgi:hypothetical protein
MKKVVSIKIEKYAPHLGLHLVVRWILLFSYTFMILWGF